MFEKDITKKFNSIEEYIKWNNELINEEIFVKKYKVKTMIKEFILDEERKVIVVLNVSIDYKGKDKRKAQCVKDIFDIMLENEPLFKNSELEILETFKIKENDEKNDSKYEFFARLKKDLLIANENNNETLFERYFDFKQKVERELHSGTFIDIERIIRKMFLFNKILIPLFGSDWNSCFEAYRYNIMDERYLSIYTNNHELNKPSSIAEDDMIRVINFSYKLMCMKSEVFKDGRIIKNNVLRIMMLNNSENRMVIFDLDIENELMIMTNRMLRDVIIDMIETVERTANYKYNIRTEGFYISETSSLIFKTLKNENHKFHYHKNKLEPIDIKNIVYIPPRKRIMNFNPVGFEWSMDDYDFDFNKTTSEFIKKKEKSSTIAHNIYKLSIDNKLGLYYNPDSDKKCPINDFLKEVTK